MGMNRFIEILFIFKALSRRPVQSWRYYFRLSISQINSCKLRIWFWSEWKAIQSELSKEQFHIQCQDIYPELMEDLQKLVASPMVTGLTVTKSRMESNFILAENEFPSTFLKALATSGVETKWAPTYILISSFELSKRLVSYSLYFVNISDIWISGWKTVFSIWWEAKVLKSGSRWNFYTWASHMHRKPFCRSSILEEWGSHLHILPRCRWGTLANFKFKLFFKTSSEHPDSTDHDQGQWEKRVLKSLNSMCMELGQSLAKPRCQNEQQELISESDLPPPIGDLQKMGGGLPVPKPLFLSAVQPNWDRKKR